MNSRYREQGKYTQVADSWLFCRKHIYFRGSPKLRSYLFNKVQRGAHKVWQFLSARYWYICCIVVLRREPVSFNLVIIANLIFLIVLGSCHVVSHLASKWHFPHDWEVFGKTPRCMSLVGEQNSSLTGVVHLAKSSCLVQALDLTQQSDTSTQHAYSLTIDTNNGGKSTVGLATELLAIFSHQVSLANSDVKSGSICSASYGIWYLQWQWWFYQMVLPGMVVQGRLLS